MAIAENSEANDDEPLYGRSPIMAMLPDLRAWNALPTAERAKAIRELMAEGFFDEDD
jgi:hypothetical protein